jgi:hypothetical protein
MSKLADAMRRAARPEARPIGFAATAVARNATVLVIARVGSAAEAGKAGKAGADAVVTTKADDAGKEAAGAIWGVEAGLKDREAAKALAKSGADFLVFDDDATDASILLEEDLGYVMRIGLDATDTFLRTVETLPLDALLVPALDGALTVRRTLDLRRVATFARKPLIVQVADAVEPAVLEALRECGVIGVVVDGAAAVAGLRARVDGLAPRRRTRDSRSVRLTPVAADGSVRIEEDDDDD